MKKLTVGSCFAGIGGIEKGLEDTGGFETKWQIENDPYALAILKKHWPHATRFEDIRNSDITGLCWVDLICGGYPCQPFSFAGKRGGEKDQRHLWPHMFGIIRYLRPRYVLLENVPGHLSMGFGRVLGDLASCGYDAEWQVLSAKGVGAPHLRRRLFVVAYPSGNGWETFGLGESIASSQELADSQSNKRRIGDRDHENDVSNAISSRTGMEEHRNHRQEWQCAGTSKPEILRQENRPACTEGTFTGSQDDPDAQGVGFSGRNMQINSRNESENKQIREKGGSEIEQHLRQWESEPDVGRVAHGIPSRVDRLRCLGNAVVPQVAQKIGEMILNFERSVEER